MKNHTISIDISSFSKSIEDALVNWEVRKYELNSTNFLFEQFLDYISNVLEDFSGAHVVEFAERLCLRLIYEGKNTTTKKMISDEMKRWGFKTRTETKFIGY